jgi:hypothetical protein
VETEPRFGDEKGNVPRYFPDDDLGTHSVAKDALVVHRMSHQSDTLKEVAKAGRRVVSAPTLPSSDVLVNPDGYVGYYLYLRESGARFADASPEEREAVCVYAMKSAVVAPGDAEGDLATAEGWFAVHPDFARQVIADFLDPVAMLL